MIETAPPLMLVPAAEKACVSDLVLAPAKTRLTSLFFAVDMDVAVALFEVVAAISTLLKAMILLVPSTDAVAVAVDPA